MNTKINKADNYKLFLILMAVIAFIYAFYIAIKFSSQLPLDNYSFRQTQTALTAFWLVRNGFSLAYETPVAGMPWSIPFEFPIYQYIVALISQATGFSLNVVGRVTSFAFLSLCLIPTRSIIKNLNLPSSVFYIFAVILFSSPLYIYWGRAFMIETAAIFFSIASIKYFIDVVKNSNIKDGLLFVIFSSLGILQKATTGLPVLVILFFIYACIILREKVFFEKAFFSKKILLASIYFGIPLLIGVMWVVYTDQIKLSNDLGANLTSSALASWNWGSLNQRLSFPLYADVIWGRVFERNLAGILGLAIFFMAFVSDAEKYVKWVMVVSVVMGLFPIFLFTNLHIVHNYYQAGSLIFFIFAISVAMGSILIEILEKKIITVFLVVVMATSNYYWFSKDYLRIIKTEYTGEKSRDLAVSDILKREIPPEKYFVSFGNDWNSSLAYFSERKSFTVPRFFKEYDAIALNPENFIKEADLGALVVCPSGGHPTIDDLTQWSSNNRSWKIGVVHDCYVAIPDSSRVDTSAKISYVKCQGDLNYVSLNSSENKNIISISGWIFNASEIGDFSEKFYLLMTKKGESILFDMMVVNRPNNNVVLSRVLNSNSLSGGYDIRVAKFSRGSLEVCNFQKKISFDNAKLY